MKKIIGIFTLAVVLFGTFGFVNGATESVLVSSGRGTSQVGADLLVLLLEVKSIELSGDIFNDKAFSNLKDFGIEIAPQPAGRDNPFSAIGF